MLLRPKFDLKRHPSTSASWMTTKVFSLAKKSLKHLLTKITHQEVNGFLHVKECVCRIWEYIFDFFPLCVFNILNLLSKLFNGRALCSALRSHLCVYNKHNKILEVWNHKIMLVDASRTWNSYVLDSGFLCSSCKQINIEDSVLFNEVMTHGWGIRPWQWWIQLLLLRIVSRDLKPEVYQDRDRQSHAGREWINSKDLVLLYEVVTHGWWWRLLLGIAIEDIIKRFVS